MSIDATRGVDNIRGNDFLNNKKSSQTKKEDIKFTQNGSASEVPKRQTIKDDKRPNVSEDMWNWMHGNFDTGNVLSKRVGDDGTVYFTVAEEAGDGTIYQKQYELTPIKKGDIAADSPIGVIIKCKHGNTEEEYVVSPHSGKIMSETLTKGDSKTRKDYNADGTKNLSGIGPQASGEAEASVTSRLGFMPDKQTN